MRLNCLSWLRPNFLCLTHDAHALRASQVSPFTAHTSPKTLLVRCVPHTLCRFRTSLRFLKTHTPFKLHIPLTPRKSNIPPTPHNTAYSTHTSRAPQTTHNSHTSRTTQTSQTPQTPHTSHGKVVLFSHLCFKCPNAWLIVKCAQRIIYNLF